MGRKGGLFDNLLVCECTYINTVAVHGLVQSRVGYV